MLAWACSNSDKEKLQAAGLAEGCALHSDCSEPLVCTFQRCHEACNKDRDCTREEQRCVKGPGGNVCQLAIETDCTNDKGKCAATQVCGADGECRDSCNQVSDCTMGQVCAPSGECASTDPTKDTLDEAGNIVADSFKYGSGGVSGSSGSSSGGKGGALGQGGSVGSGMGGSVEVGGGAGGAGNDGMSGGSSASAGGKLSSGGAATASGGSAATSGGAISSVAGAGGEGGQGPALCVPACAQGKVCVEGSCVICGGADQVCCGEDNCAANLSCNSAKKCTCGGSNEMCCSGDLCNTGLSCDTSGAQHLCSCGQLGARCCAAETPGGDSTCLGQNLCAGSKCSCIAEVQAGPNNELVRRVDGVVWRAANTTGATFNQVKYTQGTPLLATAVAASAAIGCAITPSGTVWCFPIDGTLSDSTFLGAGLGPTDATTAPVQVVTAASGPALTNVVQLSASATTTNNSFCAVVSDGSAWCWGYGGSGQLGRGDTSNSNFARKVLVNATTAFSNASEIRVGSETTCARKTDGSVWCWGTNGYGELGAMPSALASSYHPIQVTLIGTTAQRTATRLITGPHATYCAIMQDTSVECWGNNNYQQAGVPDGAYQPPSAVLLAADSAALTGVVDLADAGIAAVCARTIDRQILCWGFTNTGITAYPRSFVDSTHTAVTDIRGNLAGGSLFAYVDVSGRLTAGGVVQAQQPPCN
ncbi:MAG: hypothetical protein QM756_24195 [Polyangiaceae bacterium]